MKLKKQLIIKNNIMKKIIFLVSLVAIVSVFSACSVGYVTEEPVYQVYNRPQRPGNNYIWIEGGWSWNSRTNTYVQNNGRWVREDQGRRHKQGHWEKNQNGSRWVKGSNR
ncbi:MAG: YXWGXW repeat-containing protein [Flavobacterium sp.]|nr:YXWGXW repeat-containing protein [Flavobacterium sp.]